MRGLVTGAARGLGEAIADRLVRDGASLVLADIARQVFETAGRLATQRDDAVVLAVCGDVADEAFCERLVQHTVSTLGGLDVLVNNAGIGGSTTDLVETPPSDIRRVLDVNLIGPILLARAAARAMVAQETGGSIVNISSILGQQGVAGATAYSASKGGLRLFSHALAHELAPYRIRVNAIAPGNMATEMHWADLRATAEKNGITFEEQVQRVRASIPLGRHGTSEDIAGAVAWLVSDDASYVTGQTLTVNGGVLMT